MPGYVMHLAVCEKILRSCKISDERYKAYFRIGNIIPDVKGRNDKMESHFWDKSLMYRFARKPDVDAFLSLHGGRLNEPYILGYYSHLVLDRDFIDCYWAKHFKFFNRENEEDDSFNGITQVHLADNDTIYDRSEFFSERLFYGDYDKANPYVIKNYGISYKSISDSLEMVLQDDACNSYDVGSVDISASSERLRSMIGYLKQDDAEVMYPDLKVLDMRELEGLIENTALHIKKVASAKHLRL